MAKEGLAAATGYLGRDVMPTPTPQVLQGRRLRLWLYKCCTRRVFGSVNYKSFRPFFLPLLVAMEADEVDDEDEEKIEDREDGEEKKGKMRNGFPPSFHFEELGERKNEREQ
uniref:Uncharacterized protein n=1 Tax=Nelumbo nucifera TaxID=4432 RepID=A0A822YJD5_NELNU|nr:TPA_asm: hypothetical protein HUJ06_011453 [Nelumbo nucifera]